MSFCSSHATASGETRYNQSGPVSGLLSNRFEKVDIDPNLSK